MAIVGHPLMLAVGRVLGGIQVDDELLFVLPFQDGVGGSGESAVPLFSTRNQNPETGLLAPRINMMATDIF